MARQAHPWFRRSDGWWYVKINGALVKLAQGRQDKQAALNRWHEIMLERASNLPADSNKHTVASVIDLFLIHSKRLYAPQSYANRCYYLQLFAEAHGFRLICDCLPLHITLWLDANPQWVSDWTRSLQRRPNCRAGVLRRPRIGGFLAGRFYAATAGAFSAS